MFAVDDLRSRNNRAHRTLRSFLPQMNHLLLELIRPSAVAAGPSCLEQLGPQTDWHAFCSLAYRTGLAPLVYERLRRYSRFVPADILSWLRAQYYETYARNLLQFNNLNEVTAKLSLLGIPVLALKGHVLAKLGLGFHVRSFSDLDLLVHRGDVYAVTAILQSLGYVELLGPPHGFHKGYVRLSQGPPAGIELHFDVVDRSDASVQPDLASIWDRAVEVNILGHIVKTPELPDHLLLLIIQLANHSWGPRHLADIGALVSRWGDAFDWQGLTIRAESWRMNALWGSTLNILYSILHVNLPQQTRNCVEAESYFRRVQWQIAKQAVLEQLSYRPNERILRLASVLMVDQLTEVVPNWSRRTFPTSSNSQTDRVMPGALRRLKAGISSVPSLLGILFKSAAPMSFRSR